MEPSRVSPGGGARLRVLGTFVPELTLEQAGGGLQTELRDEFHVYIGEHESSSVQFLGPDALEVEVPDSLVDPGTYTLRVTDLWNEEAALPYAVQVAYPEPAKLSFDPLYKDPPTGVWVPIQIELQDANGLRAAYSEQKLLQVGLDSPSGQLTIDPLSGGIEQALSMYVPPGTTHVAFSFRSLDPGTYTITAQLGELPSASQQVVVRSAAGP